MVVLFLSCTKKKKPTGFRKWYLYSSAAVIALLISVYLFNPKNQTSEEIYYSHLNTIKLPSITNRGNEEEIINQAQKDKISLGKNYFDAKEYQKVVALFSEELKNGTENSIIYLSLAISQMELNQFLEAEKTLNSLIKSDLIDAEKGYWLKSLLYLKSEQLEKAKVILSLIIKNSYYNNKKAKVVLEKITAL